MLNVKCFTINIQQAYQQSRIYAERFCKGSSPGFGCCTNFCYFHTSRSCSKYNYVLWNRLLLDDASFLRHENLDERFWQHNRLMHQKQCLYDDFILLRASVKWYRRTFYLQHGYIVCADLRIHFGCVTEIVKTDFFLLSMIASFIWQSSSSFLSFIIIQDLYILLIAWRQCARTDQRSSDSTSRQRIDRFVDFISLAWLHHTLGIESLSDRRRWGSESCPSAFAFPPTFPHWSSVSSTSGHSLYDSRG